MRRYYNKSLVESHMASIDKNDELRSFDVPEIALHPGGYTTYKIILQITPKEITENSYQVCFYFEKLGLIRNIIAFS